VEDSEGFKEFKVEAVAGWKYVEGGWRNLIKLKHWQKRSWVWAEDMVGS
jgi:hypothetical protein